MSIYFASDTHSFSLPAYAVKVSARAKHVRLVITPSSGLTVVIPVGYDPARVPEVVRSRRDWIWTNLERAALWQARREPPPAEIALRAVDRVLAVRYKALPGASGVRVRGAGGGSLNVSGNIADREAVAEALRLWLKREGALALPPILDRLASRLGLEYAKVAVRLQRTRWGSCSAKAMISLNARLLFLPPELARYVMAHELAHTRHLNHSAEYWRTLETLFPGARLLDAQLRQAGRYTPGWSRP